jgi:hypothetical protein
MMKYRLWIAAVMGLMCLSGLSQAASAEGIDSTGSSETNAKGLTALGLRFVGFASVEFGQFINTYMLTSSTPHQDEMEAYVNFGVLKQVTDRFEIQARVEGQMSFNTFNQNEKGGVEGFYLPQMYYNFYFDRAFGSYSLGDVQSPYLKFTLGYFPFKYNPDARDLGEYLYRSGTYPAYLINDFDYPQARLAGLDVSSDLFGWLHQDLLLTSSCERPPWFDLNLGYIANFDIAKILNIGVGGMYQSLVPADANLTSPKDQENLYVKNAVTDSLGNIVSGDTGYYTSAGLKAMARISFDPKRIFCPSCDDFTFLGKEGLKIYGEAAVLGWEDYPASQANPYGYDAFRNKTPRMVGINLPSFEFKKFSLFDVFTAELEYYGCMYPNNYQYKDQALYLPVPVPSSQTDQDPHTYATLDNWKWAFYAKKSFKNGFYAVGQIACDHIRNESPVNAFYDSEEMLRSCHSWWWVLKLGYQF